MNDQTEKTTPLSGMIETVLSNPDLLRRVGEVLQNTQPQESAQTPPPPESSPTSMPSGGLEGLLQDPAFLQKLPQVMEMLRPMMAQNPQKPPEKPSGLPETVRKRNDLLCALKPFLTPSRAAAVDTIIHLSYLGTLPGLMQK